MPPKTESQPFLTESGSPITESSHMDLPLRSPRWVTNPSSSLSYCIVFLSTSILWGAILLFVVQTPASQLQPQPQQPDDNPFTAGTLTAGARYSSCGESTLEAKALGCQYDILSGLWLPPACVDDYSIEEYQEDGSWFGYADASRTQLLTINEMSEMEYYYTSARDHILHCAILWRKQYRAFTDGRNSLDSVITDAAHTKHCADYLVNMTDVGTQFRTMPIKVWVGYGGCFVKD